MALFCSLVVWFVAVVFPLKYVHLTFYIVYIHLTSFPAFSSDVHKGPGRPSQQIQAGNFTFLDPTPSGQ